MYQKSRNANLKQASFIPGLDNNYPLDYVSSVETKAGMPSGFNKGEHMHHLVPAEIFGAFVQNLSRQEAEIVINRANELGIRVGNDPANFIGLDGLKEHLRNEENLNTIHRQLDDIGLESSELSGADRDQFYGLLNKIANAPLQARLDALPDFVTYIAEPAIELGRKFRPKAQGIKENKAQYAQEVAAEAIRERIAHAREKAAYEYGVPLTPSTGNSQSAMGGKDLTKLVGAVLADTIDGKEVVNLMSDKRKAGDIIRQLAGRDMSELATGDVTGTAPIIINQEKDSNIYLHTNGKNNGHAKMQDKFNRV